jgi:dihydroflavonol-4-reductase
MKKDITLLTGSTGLLGSHMLVHLFQKGKSIRCLIRESASFKQLEMVCEFYQQDFESIKSSVEWVIGDTMDFVSLQENLKNVSEVYHCAAIVSFNNADNPKMLRTNVQGTANMVDAALANHVEKFCFVSSIASLGKSTDSSAITETTQRKVEGRYSGYSESKFRSELEIWRGIAEGLNAVIVNPGIILGVGDLDKGSMLLFKNGMKGMPFYTKATTGYVDVRDVCYCCIELMEQEAFNERYILVAENAHNGIVFGLIAKVFGVKSPKYEAGLLLLRMGVFVSAVISLLTGKTPQLTSNTIRSAQHPEIYSNEKIRLKLNHPFRPLKETIEDIGRFYIEKGKTK